MLLSNRRLASHQVFETFTWFLFIHCFPYYGVTWCLVFPQLFLLLFRNWFWRADLLDPTLLATIFSVNSPGLLLPDLTQILSYCPALTPQRHYLDFSSFFVEIVRQRWQIEMRRPLRWLNEGLEVRLLQDRIRQFVIGVCYRFVPFRWRHLVGIVINSLLGLCDIQPFDAVVIVRVCFKWNCLGVVLYTAGEGLVRIHFLWSSFGSAEWILIRLTFLHGLKTLYRDCAYVLVWSHTSRR